MADLITVRIPELPEQPGETLSLEDKVPVFIAAENKTKHCSINSLRDLIVVGDDGSYAPVYNGGSVIYVVPSAQSGTATASIPTLAGMNFNLYRNGVPLLPTEYEILSAGGFKLKAGLLMSAAERYELRVFELQGGNAGSGAGGLVTGKVVVTANKTLAATDANKLIQIRGANNILTIILPDGDSVPENTIIPIESTINNLKQHKIQTQNGQYIYFKSTSKTYMWIGVSEMLFLYWGGDGWYVFGYDGNFLNLTQPVAAYKVGFNQYKADGSIVNRADCPKLWEEVLTLGLSLVDDATWLTPSVTLGGRTVEKPYRGCFSTGNGVDTLRLPDLTNVALRGLKASDSDRYYNNAGGFQRNEFESHDHDSGIYNNSQDYDDGGSTPNNIGTTATSQKIKTSKSGGTETRMDNVGVIWVINY
ncbi:hypothetical protein QTN47_27415 [Danxiaibacter flavus]|uniref:Phage tail collar domain-containing protein n=1 Tax=Danxiaibacter flavus TaxID=3049108 RepID=A0ABV3ZN12_9BACT|nr:hypothetical protein QNM32_27415 [Chitinophagaceae bacterium DXS]